MSASLANAQWIADRDEYQIISPGNFHTQAHDMSTAVSIALGTLEYNGAVLRTVDVNVDEIDVPLFSHFYRKSSPEYVYICYVTRTETGYDIWFKYLIDEPIIFNEQFALLEYDPND